METLIAQVSTIHEQVSTPGCGLRADPDHEAEQNFLDWLRCNGAEFSGIKWPSCETESGMRGAVARRDIATGEHMMFIPHHLMLSEFHARADPYTGHVFREKARLLKSDNGLAVYIMQEVLKGEDSFYWPYLRILPASYNLRHWSEPGLLELQETTGRLPRRAAARTRQLRALYRDTMEVLSTAYPELFPVDRYTFELFDFAWSTLQARAFGRRLKCSALVPFADCLNHGNVQTKYDFDVNSNGVFRLFPSGTNNYLKGAEVLNSYGRRANENLLLDYGFAMLDNPWDAVEVTCCLSPAEVLFERRKSLLRASGQHPFRVIAIRRGQWSLDLLRFNRCACLTASELEDIEAHEDARSAVVYPDQSRRCGADGGEANNAGGGSREALGYASSDPRCLRPEVKAEMRFPLRPLSTENELAALTGVMIQLLEARDVFPTKLESDEKLIEANGDAYPELVNALKYRITLKRILADHLHMVERAIAHVQGIEKELESISDEVTGNAYSGSYRGTSAILMEGDDRLPLSFKAYLQGLSEVLLRPRAPLPDTLGAKDGSLGCETRLSRTVSFRARVPVADDAGCAPSTCVCSRTAAEDSRPEIAASSSVSV